MTKQEKEFKKAFKHRHVTNVFMVASTLGAQLRICFRYDSRRMYNEMRKRIDDTAKKLGNLDLPIIQSADVTKNYEYDIITYRITK